jgi:hypothetical protein
MASAMEILSRKAKQNLLHWRARYISHREWKDRFSKIFEQNPSYQKPCSPSVEKQHIARWQALAARVNLDTLRVCYNISGVEDADMIPEEIYRSEIEPCLNHYPNVEWLSNKNFYNRWFPGDVFPRVYLHNIDGDFYDENYEILRVEQVDRIINNLPFPVVIKPSLGSYGGANVYFPKTQQELRHKMAAQQNYVVQEKIQQHEFFDRFNRYGLNTLRVCTYRSVKTNQVQVLNVSLRMGKGGSLDNETAGGIVCSIADNGRFHKYALDKYGEKFLKHPDTGLIFSELDAVPRVESLKAFAVRIAQQLHLTRLASLDISFDANERWRMIEFNLFGQTIRFAQYAGKPFFGPFTTEVIEYCQQHPDWR